MKKKQTQNSITYRQIPFVIAIIVVITSIILAGSGNTSTTLTRLSSLLSHLHLGIRSPLTSIFQTNITRPIASSSPTMSSYTKELKVAQLAVSRASILTKSVFTSKVKGTVSKDDKSPVTIGDFGAQALIIAAIKHNFPSDQVVGEEEASSLRSDHDLSSKIWELVKDVHLTDSESDSLLGGPIPSESAMLDAIDAGNSSGGNQGRIWALDPIDGTKGFLRGGQYAVCLALMVDGIVKVGVLGCPNLPVDDSAPLTEDMGMAVSESNTNEINKKGVLFSAVESQGATSQPLTTSGGSLQTTDQKISVNKITDVSQARICESVEAGHSSKGDNAEIAKLLNITGKPVQMDSQAKYGSVARGAGDLYLRLPVRKDYVEKIWDHAAGDLIVREAGGMVTDIHGNRLNFSLGRTLKENKGVVAAPAAIHAQALEAVRKVLSAKQ